METEEHYSAGDYLVVDSRVRGGEIDLDIKHVNVVDLGIEPAVLISVTWEDFRNLDNGSYKVTISWEEKSDTYAIVITDSSIVIAPEVQEFTNHGYDTYWRYPENSFHCFGYTGDSSEEALFEGLIDSFTALSNIESYEFPQQRVNAFRWADGDWKYTSQYFTYNDEDDFDIFEDYAVNVIPDTSISYIYIRNWKNEKYSTDDYGD